MCDGLGARAELDGGKRPTQQQKQKCCAHGACPGAEADGHARAGRCSEADSGNFSALRSRSTCGGRAYTTVIQNEANICMN